MTVSQEDGSGVIAACFSVFEMPFLEKNREANRIKDLQFLSDDVDVLFPLV